MLLPLQGVNAMIIRVPQGVASLALLGAFGLCYALSAEKHAEKIVDFEHPTHSG